MNVLQRACPLYTITVGTATASSTVIPFGNFAGGQVFVPSGSSITLITWHGSYDGVTYLPILDAYGIAVTSTVGSAQCCPIPVSCFGCPYLKATDSAGGSAYVTLKS